MARDGDGVSGGVTVTVCGGSLTQPYFSQLLMMLSFPAPANGGQPVQNDAGQTMRLRDDQPVINHPARTTRKRKSPAAVAAAPNPDQPLHHVLPPPHTLMHLSPPLPPGFPYAAPADYTPGGLPPGGLPLPQQSDPHQQPHTSASGRTLSNSKRAEQNRKAQRAFRERRDQSVSPAPFQTPSAYALTDTSRLSSLAPSSSTPRSPRQTRQIAAGNIVASMPISSRSRMLLSVLKTPPSALKTPLFVLLSAPLPPFLQLPPSPFPQLVPLKTLALCKKKTSLTEQQTKRWIPMCQQ